MATSLAKQLAQIAAHSSNPLDLKAQKKAHSQSLLFEQTIAASQDFDTIYQICVEGYQELCQIDNKFVGFSRSIFSEQSKREDRLQMTVEQNRELDEVLESFLGLVGSRILLKPALKAIEWLIRRFRIHESNTICLILTFLPYHTLPVFANLLSIIPKNLPPPLKFLHPYVESYACPPRHTIIHTATHNKAFFTALNSYVLRICRNGQQYRGITSYWATIVTEAVVSMIDQAGSGRREAQRQKEEDVLHRVLPILNEGLSMQEVPDLRVGCYMLLTVLASKMRLEDRVLDAMMTAVVSAWTEDTTHAGLICLAVLAQQKVAARLPNRVFKAVMALANISDDLLTLSRQYQVDRLTHGLVQGVLDRLDKGQDKYRLAFVRTALESHMMDSSYVASSITSLLLAAGDVEKVNKRSADTQGQLADLVLTLIESKAVGSMVQTIIRDTNTDVQQLEMTLQRVISLENDQQPKAIQDAVMEDIDRLPETFDALASRIPTRTAYEISFLSHSKSYVFESLCQAFISASSSPTDLKKFSDLPVLRKSLAMTEPLFMSFFIRTWCGPFPAQARSTAIGCVRECIEETDNAADLQILLPYIIHALSDSSAKVREAATGLVLTLATRYENSNGGASNPKECAVLGHDSIYGQADETKAVKWLNKTEVSKVVTELLLPNIEECRLDSSFISKLVADFLNGSNQLKNSKSPRKDYKTSFRVGVLTTLSSHIINTPLYSVKFQLLSTMNKVGKVGSSSRTKALLPFLTYQETISEETIKASCDKARIDVSQFICELTRIVLPGDRDGLRALQSLVTSANLSPSSILRKAAFQRLCEMWKSIKSDMQLSLSEAMLQLVINGTSMKGDEEVKIEASETLRAVSLSENILLHFLENLPALSAASDGKDGPSSSKRRRLSHGRANTHFVPVADALRQMTFVFELVESSAAGVHASLLNTVFRVFADIQHYRSQSGNEMGYLQSLVLQCLHSIIEAFKATTSFQLDRSVIRADLIVDCLRITTIPQVQHSALLLMSSLATVVPEVIIHSVMPVFTFMGPTVLRQSDDYSAHVIDLTIESVIPPLIASLQNQKGGPLAGASELLLSFVAAFEHVPIHRRIGLYSSLTDKLGPNDFLFALLAMILDRYAEDKNVGDFVRDLAGQYSALTQLKTMERLLGVVLDSLKPKPTISTLLLGSNDQRTRASTGVLLLSLPMQIFSTQRLISKIAKVLEKEDHESIEVRKIYSQMMEQTLQLVEQAQPYKKLPAACDQLLHALLGLLSMHESINSLETLLDGGNSQIQRQVLRSLENRINVAKMGDSQTQKACINFLPRLASTIEATEDPLLMHSVVACIDRITEKYGKKDTDRFSPVIRVLSSGQCLGASDPRLRVITLLCLATAVEVLGETIIPIIPQALPKSIDYLRLSIEDGREDEPLHDAVYAFIGALLSYIPWLVTGQYLDQFLRASHESANAGMSTKCDQSRKEVLSLVAKRIDIQECFAALDRTWNSAVAGGPEAVSEHLDILQLAIEKQPKSAIVKQSQTLHGLFLKAFDTRRIQFCPRTEDSYEEDEVEVVEQKVNEVAIKMIYKLNDASFRPLFIKTQEWASAAGTKKDRQGKMFRQTTWYTFLHAFFDTLKSIITSYASYIIDDTVAILQNLNPSNPDSVLLFNRVLNTLQSSFEHDQDDFWQSHFPAIHAPLLATVPLLPTSPLLPPTITALAAAADSPAHHKSLNAGLLAYMRSESPAVRKSAIVCQRSLTKKLGEEWLALLPEMLPFMSEGMEDGDEDVETEVRGWVAEVEGILGESLDGMLA